MGSLTIGADHLFLGMLRLGSCDAVKAVSAAGVDIAAVKRNIEALIAAPEPVPFDKAGEIEISDQVKEIFEAASTRFARGGSQPGTLHILLAIMTSPSGVTRDILLDAGVDLRSLVNMASAADTSAESESIPKQAETGAQPLLDEYGRDLTAAAASGRLDPVVGRDAEIRKLAMILCRRKKNNPVLIGEPGTGKTAIVEGLAALIASGRAPKALSGRRIVSLEVGSLVAGTKFRGQFEERIKGLLKEISSEKGLIIFIDELHTIVGAGGGQGSIDAANLLKPALACGRLQCIGATTEDEYRNFLERDAALDRRFQKVVVEPSDFAQTLEILKGIREQYETFHGVHYSDEALEACITLSQRYINDRCLPDKAIDVLDFAGSLAGLDAAPALCDGERLDNIRAAKRDAALEGDFAKAAALRRQEKEILSNCGDAHKAGTPVVEITADDVAKAVSSITRIPVHRIAGRESDRLLNMEPVLKGEVIGQDDAVVAVSRAIRRNRTGMKDPLKPVGTFLFVGPTGVGKTLLAKKIAEYMFGSADRLVRIDMSEYLEKFSVSRLVGAPPGYVGYQDGGQLSEAVRRNPYCVVLLDEIEKAHPDIFNLLLQVLDEGRLTDGRGRSVDFRNAVIILTSNVGSRQVADFGGGVGFSTASARDCRSKAGRNLVSKALGKTFAPEFLNRLDEIVYFNTLSREDICSVVGIETASLKKRMAASGFDLTIDDDALQFIAGEGYDSDYGARPLKRAVQRYVEDPIADLIVGGSIPESRPVVVRVSLNGDGTGTVATCR